MVDKTGYFESLLPVIYMLLTKGRKRPPTTYLSTRVCPLLPLGGNNLWDWATILLLNNQPMNLLFWLGKQIEDIRIVFSFN